MIALHDKAITNFRNYLKFPTVHPNNKYLDCRRYLLRIAYSMELKVVSVNIMPETPVLLITWIGTHPQVPSVLLVSHMDVAPVIPEDWTEDPFGGELKDGKIYGRGAQDSKCIGIQYLEAIRKLKSESKVCLQNIHVCFLPDGEVGCQAMASFVNTDEYRELKVGVCLDAGWPSVTDEYFLFTGDKMSWQFTFTCRGSVGHNTLLIGNTAAEQLTFILKKASEFREQQANILQEQNNPDDVVVINCTQVGGGNQEIFIPTEFTVTFDCLIPCSYDLETFEEMLNGWCQEAGSNCTLKIHLKQHPTPETKLASDNPFWIAFRDAVEGMNLKLKIHKGWNNSDCRHLRARGIPCFNFSPINGTRSFSQGPDEHLSVETFLRGINIYSNIILKLANAW
ncbi:hypothetical protein WA026_005689 [Henosepilachna vigintioctopunctata]|uniref:N-acyl-aliphatic-L-amino acid amidohydrolase n=1 Tax=Henosepilachna vigintioctopunctata TaxID=420089 RepID=A0AAW1U1V4_9CUCU